MNANLLCLCFLGTTLSTMGQFYPDSNAVWCGVDDNGGPPGYDVQLQMDNAPDTTIGGIVYKKVTEYNDESGEWQYVGVYYVRSDASGKGYIYLPDSMAEFLTGDATAQAGDTVHDVLTGLPNGSFYGLVDLLVDSVVVLSNAGVTVTRHYVDPDIFNPLSADVVFWQEGMGVNWGPIFRLSGIPHLSSVNDTVQYDIDFVNLGYVGQICWQISAGISNTGNNEVGRLQFTPNPSTGLFHINHTTRQVSIYNAQGRLLFQTHGPVVDLNAYPPGVYTAVVQTAKGSSALRLVVMR